MANPKIADAGKGTQFKPGVSPNPGGKPVGSRNKLQGDFLRALSDDFEKNGKAAIVTCREEKPDAYLKVIASLMPKELEIKRPTEEMSDEELAAALAALRSLVVAQTAGKGSGPAVAATPTDGLPTLQ